MDERTPPEGMPPDEPMPAASGSPEPPLDATPSGGPLGWPERATDAEPAIGGASTAAPTAMQSPPAPPPAPPVHWQAPPAPAVMTAGRQPRTTLSAVAGVALLALGIIGLLFGVLFVASAAFLAQLMTDFAGQLPGIPEGMTVEQFVGGVLGFFGVLVIAYSTVYVLGGIGVLRSSEWGRVLGIIVAIISGLIWGSGLSGTVSEGFAFTLAMFLIHLYVFFALAFKWRQPLVAPTG